MINKKYAVIVVTSMLSIQQLHCTITAYLDANTKYRAWFNTTGSGRCAVRGVIEQQEEWQFADFQGSELDIFINDPCSYQITCPQIASFDPNAVLCTCETDWNKSLTSCTLASSITAQQVPSGSQEEQFRTAATLDADKQYKCFVNGNTRSGRFFYPREEMEPGSVCGSTVYAVTDADAPEAVMSDTPQKKSNVLCHTYTTGDPKPQCGRTKTSYIAQCAASTDTVKSPAQ